jgi:hypothetical protein
MTAAVFKAWIDEKNSAAYFFTKAKYFLKVAVGRAEICLEYKTNSSLYLLFH